MLKIHSLVVVIFSLQLYSLSRLKETTVSQVSTCQLCVVHLKLVDIKRTYFRNLSRSVCKLHQCMLKECCSNTYSSYLAVPLYEIDNFNCWRSSPHWFIYKIDIYICIYSEKICLKWNMSCICLVFQNRHFPIECCLWWHWVKQNIAEKALVYLHIPAYF